MPLHDDAAMRSSDSNAMRILCCLCVVYLVSFPFGAAAQSTEPDSSDIFSLLPLPPLDAVEAAHRCPADEDTVATNVLGRIRERLPEPASVADSLSVMLSRLDQEFLVGLRQRLEQQIQAIGEEVDSAIRACPKVRDRNGRLVYDSLCVVRVEHHGYRNRIKVVNQYLTGVRHSWADYLQEVRRLRDTLVNSGPYIARYIAQNVAVITQTAAQFAR